MCTLISVVKCSVPWTKPISRNEQLFDQSSLYIKFGRNLVINDQVRVSKRVK